MCWRCMKELPLVSKTSILKDWGWISRCIEPVQNFSEKSPLSWVQLHWPLGYTVSMANMIYSNLVRQFQLKMKKRPHSYFSVTRNSTADFLQVLKEQLNNAYFIFGEYIFN